MAKTYRSKLVFTISIIFVQMSASAQDFSMQFFNYCNGKPVEYNKTIYTNSLGTEFQINQIQYFVSNFSIFIAGKEVQFPLNYYVDEAYNNTSITLSPLKLKIPKNATIDSVRFTFGFSKEGNQSYMYKNKPESLMFWPEVLGGGYHYMKTNIKYINKDNELALFNCHLGRGQIKENDTTTFVDNDFTVTLPCSIAYNKKEMNIIPLRMDMEKWFYGPNVIDFNDYMGIMDKQNVMSKICENGQKAFSISK